MKAPAGSGWGWAAATVSWVLLLQLHPLTRTLGYEQAMAMALWQGTFLLYHLASWSDAEGAGGGAWGRLAVRLLVLLLLALGVALVAEGVRGFCGLSQGLAWWAALVFALVPWTLVLALVLRRLCGERRAWIVASLGVLWLVSSASALAFFYAHPPLRVLHVWLGPISGSIYDEAVGGLDVAWLHRTWLALWAALYMLVLRWPRPIVGSHVALLVLVLALLGVVYANRAPWGLELHRAFVERELGGRLESARYVVYFERAAFDATRRDALMEDIDRRYEDLVAFWGVVPRHQLRLYIYASAESKGRLTGSRSTMLARIWQSEAHLVWRGPEDELLAHEMAHLFLRDDGRGPFRLSARWGLVPQMSLVEGSATAAAWGAPELTYHGWAAALVRADMAPSVEAMLGARFWQQPGPLAYTLAGSFVRWLIEERGGVEPFRAWYASGGPPTQVYGQDLGALEEEWRSMLLSLPLAASEVDAARARFGRASLMGRVCGREVARAMEVAREAARAGGRGEALEASARALRLDPEDGRRTLEVAHLWRSVGALDEALELALRAAEEEGWAWSLRVGGALLASDLLVLRGDEGRARGLIERASSWPLQGEQRLALWLRQAALEERERSPASAEALTLWWVMAPRTEAWARYAALVEAALREAHPAVLVTLAPSVGERPDAALQLWGQIMALDAAALPLEARERLLLARVEGVARSVSDAAACALWRHYAETLPHHRALGARARLAVERCER